MTAITINSGSGFGLFSCGAPCEKIVCLQVFIIDYICLYDNIIEIRIKSKGFFEMSFSLRVAV